MKTLILTCLFWMGGLAAYAQPTEWFPVGAEWYYGAGDNYNGGTGYLYMTVEKDTIYAGELARKMLKYEFYDGRGIVKRDTFYLKIIGDTVWVYHPDSAKYNLLYNFDAPINTRYNVPPYNFYFGSWPDGYSTIRYRYKVVEHGVEELNQVMWDYIKVENFEGMGFSEYAIERIYKYIGNTGAPFPQFYIIDGGAVELCRCFIDESTSTEIHFSDMPCDYTNATVSRASYKASAGKSMKYYRRQEQIMVTNLVWLPNSNNILSVFDGSGKCLLRRQIKSGQESYVLQENLLAPGIYIVLFNDQNLKIPVQ
ncbi:MAG: hypothetical protein KF690_06535 [Bacteroidetes bacterium]|nr:hypothetical protein [Bacteroidota bacterium]